MDKKDVVRKVLRWCSGCPKAYDHTCSGKDAQRCAEQKAEYLKTAAEKENPTLEKAGKNKPEGPCETCTVFLGGSKDAETCAGCTEKTDT